MSNSLVIGTKWGDSGKAKILLYLIEHGEGDVVGRYHGGHNAGHTAYYKRQKFVTHILPSGVLHNKILAIGPNVVICPKAFIKELDLAKTSGFTNEIWIDPRAPIILPFEYEIEAMRENALGDKKIGTTKMGIGPTYEDMMRRSTKMTAAEFVSDKMWERLIDIISQKEGEMRLYGVLPPNKSVSDYALEIAEQYASHAAVMKQYVLSDGGLRYRLEEAYRAGKSIIGEGAHGTMLDIIHGTKRYQTSSSTTAGAFQADTGFPLSRFARIIGVFKVYDTRVGAGPFPTELADQIIAESRRRGDQMSPEDMLAFLAHDPVAVSKYVQIKGDEFGATSGRGRRVGWHDLVVSKYDCLLNNFTEAAITRLDTIADVEFRVCDAYTTQDRRISQEVPEDLSTVQPVYMNRSFFWPQSAFEGNNLQKMIDEGWKALPKDVKEFLSVFCQYTDTPVSMLGVGKETEAIVTKDVMLETMGMISKQKRDEIIAWKEMAYKICGR